MKKKDELPHSLYPPRSIQEFAKEEAQVVLKEEPLSEGASIRDILEKSSFRPLLLRYPLPDTVVRYLSLRLYLEEKNVLDTLYMEFVEEGHLSLQENVDHGSLTGLFWSVIMEKENDPEANLSFSPIVFDYRRLLALKKRTARKVSRCIGEIKKIQDEMLKLNSGLETYNEQIDVKFKEKSVLLKSLYNIEKRLVVSEEKQQESHTSINRLKVLEKKLSLYQQRLKALKVRNSRGRKEYVDEGGKTLPSHEVEKIKEEYKRLLVEFKKEEEKCTQKRPLSTIEQQETHQDYLLQVQKLNEELSELEKTRKAYHDFRIILGARYEQELKAVFELFRKSQLIDAVIDYHDGHQKYVEEGLGRARSLLDELISVSREHKMETEEVLRLFQSCRMQEEMLNLEQNSLKEYLNEIERTAESVNDNLEKHTLFNRRLDQLAEDFQKAKGNGSLLAQERLSFFKTVFTTKLKEAGELLHQYRFYRKLETDLHQNYAAVYESYCKNERQYQEQKERIHEGIKKLALQVEKFSERCLFLDVDVEFLLLYLQASSVATENWKEKINTVKQQGIHLLEEAMRIKENTAAIDTRTYLELAPVRELAPLREIETERLAREEDIRQFLEEIDELSLLGKNFQNLPTPKTGLPEDDAVIEEMIGTLKAQLASLNDQLADTQLELSNLHESSAKEIEEKENRIADLEERVAKLSTTLLEGHGREEKLLATLDEERKRNKELEEHILNMEERFRDENQPFWKRNILNTISTVFFVSGMLYSAAHDLPWERIELQEDFPYIQTGFLSDKPKVLGEKYLFSQDSHALRRTMGTLPSPLYAGKEKEEGEDSSMIVELEQYRISVDGTGFIDSDAGKVEEGTLQAIVAGEIRKYGEAVGIDPEAFIDFYKAVYPNCHILKKEQIEHASSLIYAMQEKYGQLRPHFRGDEERQRYGLRALELLARLQLKVEDPNASFITRLYNEYHHIGYTPEATKEAILNNLASIQKQYRAFFTPRYKGALKPIDEIERMEAEEFIQFILPYLRGKYLAYKRQNGLPYDRHREEYLLSLAEDIYFTGKMFNVPRTMMILIGHQETFFHNLRGDHGKSEGTFQIYDPTKKGILGRMKRKNIVMPRKIPSLLKYHTFSTMMATYHMSELMERYSTITFKNGVGYIEYNLKKCATRYNGSEVYSRQVIKKLRSLRSYVEKRRSETGHLS